MKAPLRHTIVHARNRGVGARALGDNELVALVLGSGCASAASWQSRTGCCRARRPARPGPAGLRELARCRDRGRPRVAGCRRGRARRRTLRIAGARLQFGRPSRGGVSAAGLRGAPSSSSASCCSTQASRAPDGGPHGRHVELEHRSRARSSARRCWAAPRRSWCFTTIRPAIRRRARTTWTMTRRLVAAGEMMGIDVVDHIILGDMRYCSFKEMGRFDVAHSLFRLLLRHLRRHGARRDARRRPAARRPEARARQPRRSGFDVSAVRVLRAGVSATRFTVHEHGEDQPQHRMHEHARSRPST